MPSAFSAADLTQLRKLKTPTKVQAFIDALHYNNGKRIALSQVFHLRKADCLEAACFAAYVLRLNGVESFIMDLSAVRDDDHVLCIYRQQGRFGAVAQSKYLGLKFRSPVYASLRELAMSYFEHYFSFTGELTLRWRSSPMHLPSNEGVWVRDPIFMVRMEKRLNEVKHIPLVPESSRYPRVDCVRFGRETLVIPRNAKVGRPYHGIARTIRKID